MIWGDKLRRWGRGKNLWLYLAVVSFTLTATLSFVSQDDVQGLAYLFLVVFYIILSTLPRVDSPVLKRGLNALMLTLLTCFMLITFGSDNRHLAPTLNRVLPHVEMDVAEMWTLTRGDERALQAGNTRVFSVILQSHHARGVGVDAYDFELEVGGSAYKDALYEMAGSCDRRRLPHNRTLSCYITFAAPENAVEGTLIFADRNYTAWADVSF